MKFVFKNLLILCMLVTSFAFSACSEGSKYTISFSVDGEIVDTIETSGNEELSFPTPEKDGHNFVGWFLDEELTQEIKGDHYKTKALTEDITLYAKFELTPQTHTISFDVGGEIVDTLETAGNESLDFPTPAKDGYEFKTWCLDENLLQEILFKYCNN